jgi:hypothetical protein
MPVIGRNESFGKRCTIMLFWLGPHPGRPRPPTLMACTEYIMFTDLIGCDKSKDRRERQFHGRMHCLFDWFSFLIVVVVCEPIPVVGATTASRSYYRYPKTLAGQMSTVRDWPNNKVYK